MLVGARDEEGPVHQLIAVTLDPTTEGLPGWGAVQRLSNQIGGAALLVALLGVVVGAAAWALGSHSQNYHQSYAGRRAVLVSGLAALLIGAAPTIVNFFLGVGREINAKP
jgi:hypothetical protein